MWMNGRNLCFFNYLVFICVVHLNGVLLTSLLSSSDDDGRPGIQPFTFPEVVMVGDKVSATCAVRKGKPPFTFHWLKNGRHLTDDVVTVRHLEEESILKIDRVQPTDGANFTCNVRNQAGDTSSYSALLHVKAGPTWKKKPMNRTLLSGGVAEFVCEVNGSPKPVVKWFKKQFDGSKEWEVSAGWKKHVMGEGKMSITEVTRSDQAIYTCRAHNGYGRNLTASAFLKVSVAPKVQRLSFPEVVALGEQTQLVCGIRAGTPPMLFTWSKDGRQIKDDDSIQQKITTHPTVSILELHEVQTRHSGNFTCMVENAAGSDQMTIQVNVLAPPKWLDRPSPEQKALQDSSVQLQCNAQGYPRPNVTWFWHKTHEGGGEGVLTPVIGGSVTKGTLKLAKVSKSQEGTYVCRVANGVGQTLSASVRLIVPVAAHFEERFKVETVRRGERATLVCHAYGDHPLTITWAKDKEKIHLTDTNRYEKFETISDDDLTSELIIRSVERADGALYTCTAENEYGSDEKNLKVLVVEVPAQPLDVRTPEIWSRSCSLTWSPPFGGNSPITNYLVQYWRHKEGAHRLLESAIPSSQTSTVLKDLHPGSDYAVAIVAENRIGTGEASPTLHFTTAEEEPDGPPSDVSAVPMGATTILVKWKNPLREHCNGAIKGFYVGYQVARSNQPLSYKSVDSSDGTNEYLLTNLVRSTFYSLQVKAFNSAGIGPPSHDILARTLDGDLPEASSLTLASTTHASISLRWRNRRSKLPITGYTLHYKKESGDWRHIPITKEQQNAFTVNGLESGSVYQLYMTANNDFGRGQPSDLLTVRTELTGVTQARPFFLDLALVVPVAAACIAIFITGLVVFVYMKKAKERRSLTHADMEKCKYNNASSSLQQQRYIDFDGSTKGGRPISYPDPGTPAASSTSYATIPSSREGEDDELRTYNVAHQNASKERPTSYTRQNSSSNKKTPASLLHQYESAQ